MKVDARFLLDEGLMAQMVHNNAKMPLRLYLKLLRENKKEYNIDYEQTARYLGIKIEKQRSNYRTQVRSVVDELKNKYGLVDYQAVSRGKLRVRLTDNKNESYFVIPMAFWQYGLDERLTPLEMMSYFICLYQDKRATPALYWWMGFEVMESVIILAKRS